MIQIDLKKNLSVKVKTDILVYLESRPLGEIYSLFQSIVSELAEDRHGTDDKRSKPATAGSGGANLRGDCILPLED